MAQLKVTGTVSRLFFNDKGVEIAEAYTVKENTYTRKFVCWFDAPQTFREGDTVTVVGDFSAKIDNWTNADGSAKLNRDGQPGQSVKVELNNVTATVAKPVAPADAPF